MRANVAWAFAPSKLIRYGTCVLWTLTIYVATAIIFIAMEFIIR